VYGDLNRLLAEHLKRTAFLQKSEYRETAVEGGLLCVAKKDTGSELCDVWSSENYGTRVSRCESGGELLPARHFLLSPHQ